MQRGPMLKKEPPKVAKITGLAWNPTGDQLASSGQDCSIKVIQKYQIIDFQFWGRSKNFMEMTYENITGSVVLENDPERMTEGNTG